MFIHPTAIKRHLRSLALPNPAPPIPALPNLVLSVLRLSVLALSVLSLTACDTSVSGTTAPETTVQGTDTLNSDSSPSASSAWTDASDTAPLNAMQLQELPMPEEDQQQQDISPINTHSTIRVYEYQTDRSMKEIHFFIEEFKDGILTCLDEAGGPASECGTFSVLFNPDEITLSWEGGTSSHPINSDSGDSSTLSGGSSTLSGDSYTLPDGSSILSPQLSEPTTLRYNEKEAVAAVVFDESGSAENVDAADYHDLLSLKEKNYERVIFVTAAFTDFSVRDGLASYHGTLRDKSVLSSDTIRWLEHYQRMDVFHQLCLSYMPPEFMNVTGTDLPALTADAEPVPDTEAADWLLVVDGALYRGTAEVGPMGDSDCVGGHITSSVRKGEIPSEEGQSNLDSIGSPYTWDSGDGMIMVSVDGEWHIFYREETSPLTGNDCAYIK